MKLFLLALACCFVALSGCEGGLQPTGPGYRSCAPVDGRPSPYQSCRQE